MAEDKGAEGAAEEGGGAESKVGPYLAPFNPSGADVIADAASMLQLCADDVLWDLGCGDGRSLVAAAKTCGCRGIGVEYDLRFVERARRAVEDGGVGDMVEIRHGNALDVDLAEARKIFVYLLPRGMAALRDRFLEVLRGGGLVVSYTFSIKGLQPAEVRPHGALKLYLYTSESCAGA